MLKKMTIRNFKAIQDMTIEFMSFTVLIGGNSCGKSTILQALDFLRSASIRDIPEYLREKGWGFDELKSQLNDGKNAPITFIAVFEFTVNDKIESIEWTFIISHANNQFDIKEKIIRLSDNSPIFARGFCKDNSVVASDTKASINNSSAVAHDINEIILEASWLKYLPLVQDSPELSALKKFLLGSTYFGLLSPDTIRKGDKNEFTVDIGQGGISLASFIHHGLIDEQKNALNEIVSKFVGFSVRIKTIDLGGRIEFYIEETFDGSTTRINKDHVSDGLLRIISFAAISLQKKTIFTPLTEQGITQIENKLQIDIVMEEPDGMILLDEIENGINPYLTENINGLLNELAETNKRQIIITTHSPIILNDIAPGNITLLWKDTSGSVHCRKLFSISELHESLDFLNPGDAWMNIREEDLLAKASSEPEAQL
jgi:predicted ATPase